MKIELKGFQKDLYESGIISMENALKLPENWPSGAISAIRILRYIGYCHEDAVIIVKVIEKCNPEYFQTPKLPK